jgi:glycosyltransferase involved in cell wall biosynthesis
MKILMLCSGSIHSTLSHRPLSIAKQLVLMGHQVEIIAPSLDKHSHFQVVAPKSIEGVVITNPAQLKTHSFLINLVPYLFSSVFKVFRSRPDVVFIYKPTPITLVGLIAKWVFRIPMLLDLDDLGSEVMKREGHPAVVYELVSFSEWLCARQASVIMAASSLLEKQNASLYPNAQIVRISNGVDPEEFTPRQARDTPHILFTGMLSSDRFVRPLIEALPEVKKKESVVHIDILGDGPSRPSLEQLAKSLGVEKNITFHGWVKHSEIPKYAAAGDIGICIMPGDRATQAASNQKVFEYMAMELCVIASNVGDLPQYMEHGNAGVILPTDQPGDLAIVILNLLIDTQTRRRLAARGRELAETQYSWSKLAGTVEATLGAAK